MNTKPDPKTVDQFAKENLEPGTAQSVFKNLVSENQVYWDFFTSLNGSFKEKFTAYMQEPPTKKNEWLEREIATWKQSKEKKTVTPPEEILKPEPVKKVDIKADPKTRRLLINTLGMLYDVQPETAGNLSAMLMKAKERHSVFCQKASSFLGTISPGSTAVKSAVEGHGLVRFFANVFGIPEPLEPIERSSELAALTTVWVHNYQKEWAGTNAEMPDEERLKRFEEKRMWIIQKTADDIATFGGYESSDELFIELRTTLPEAIALLQEHVTAL